MDIAGIIGSVIRYAQAYTPHGEIPTTESKITDDLQMDSLDMLEFVLDLEYEFKINVDDNEIDKCNTLNDVINYVSGILNDPTKKRILG